jgi:hypothetical protein
VAGAFWLWLPAGSRQKKRTLMPSLHLG